MADPPRARTPLAAPDPVHERQHIAGRPAGEVAWARCAPLATMTPRLGGWSRVSAAANEIRRVLGRLDELAGAPPAVVERLCAAARLEAAGEGQLIVSRGEAAPVLYFVVSGKVEGRALDERGREVDLGPARTGEPLGPLAALEGRTHEVTYEAAARTALLGLPADALQRAGREFPPLIERLRARAERQAREQFLRLRSRLASDLPGGALRALAADLQQEGRCAAGGAPPDEAALRVLTEGELEVVREGPQGRLVMGRVLPGDTFAEDRLLGRAGATRLVASQPARWRGLTADATQRWLGRCPELKRHVEARAELWQRLDADPSTLRRSAHRFYALGFQSTVDDEQGPRLGRPAAADGFPVERQSEPGAGAGAMACLRMALRHLGVVVEERRLRTAAGGLSERPGVAEVAATAETLGLYAREQRLPYEALRSADLPVIISWDEGRYAVLYRVEAERAWVVDPLTGPRQLTRAELTQRWGGRLLLLEPAPQLADPEAAGPWRRVLAYFRPHRGLLVQVGLIGLCLHVLALALPKFTEMIVDDVVVHADLTLLDYLLIGMLVVQGATLALEGLRTYILAQVGRRLGFSMVRSLYARLLDMPLSYFQRHDAGELIKRFGDMRVLQDLVLGSGLGLALDVLSMGVYVAYMLHYSGALAGLALAFVLPYGLLVLFEAPRLARRSREMYDADADLQAHMVDAVEGIETVKALGLEAIFHAGWQQRFHKTLNLGYGLTRLTLFSSTLRTALHQGAVILLLWAGARRVMAGDMTVGELMAFNAVVGAAFGPVRRLLSLTAQLEEAKVALERVDEVLSAPVAAASRPHALAPERLEGSLELEGVSFRYDPDGPDILTDVSIRIPAGQTVAIVGRSGSGKSTLARIALGLLEPTGGQVRLDGIDIGQLSVGTLRRMVGSVNQEPQLFDTTIAENITFGGGPFDAKRLEEAVQLAAADDVLAKLPLGYATIVGEGGRNLSGGQRQRIALARVFYRAPRLLVLDEATSALDSESERRVRASLERFLQDRSALVIAHRLSTVRNADHIIVLDEGRVVEQGTHEALVAERGIYYHLVREQLEV